MLTERDPNVDFDERCSDRDRVFFFLGSVDIVAARGPSSNN